MSGLASGASAAAQSKTRVRPGDPAWPSEASWDQLSREVDGRLIKVRSPLAACVGVSSDGACVQVFKELKNPYYLGDEVGLTQSLGWVGAWTSEPSVYAVAAKTARDVVGFAIRRSVGCRTVCSLAVWSELLQRAPARSISATLARVDLQISRCSRDDSSP
jgi:hypothetical protein